MEKLNFRKEKKIIIQTSRTTLEKITIEKKLFSDFQNPDRSLTGNHPFRMIFGSQLSKMLLIHDVGKVENTERKMRLQSLLVQLSKTTANFSSTEETKLEQKITLSENCASPPWVWGTSNGCNVTAATWTPVQKWQRWLLQHSVNNRELEDGTEEKPYTCKTRQKTRLGLQGAGEQRHQARWQLTRLRCNVSLWSSL